MFAKDKKWNIAKNFIKEQGMQDNWIEIVDYYRQLGGSHVAVFIYINQVKYRILEATKDNRVVVIDKNDNLHLMDYNKVLESRKVFFYIEEPSTYDINLSKDIQKVTYSNQDKITISK